MRYAIKLIVNPDSKTATTVIFSEAPVRVVTSSDLLLVEVAVGLKVVATALLVEVAVGLEVVATALLVEVIIIGPLSLALVLLSDATTLRAILIGSGF